MNRSASPGLGQWITVSLLVASALFLIIQLYQYAGVRTRLPTGLTIGGIDVGGMTNEQAEEVIANRYLQAPIAIYYGEERYEISPSDAEFELDWEEMFSRADYERVQQDFWAGFWGFLWGRPVDVTPIPLTATHEREALRDTLETITQLLDRPAQPPQPVPSSLSFQYGVPGVRSNIELSFADIEAAMYRPTQREAFIVLEPTEPERPNINLLARLLVNHLQDFEQATGGTASVFIMDLETGEEVTINADVAMSGIDALKIPIALELFRQLDRPPTLSQSNLISQTLVINTDNEIANELLRAVSGNEDTRLGAELVNNSLQRLGLVNSFMVAPYDFDRSAGTTSPETPANSVEGLRTAPTPNQQSTAEDMGVLLSMIYYCAEGMGGTLAAVFGETLTATECQDLLTYMSFNDVDFFIEQGVPEDIQVAHRHGWNSNTHVDAGVVYTPGGNYVLVQYLYMPGFLQWEQSAPLFADISRATYNFFNFDDPFLNDSRAN